MPAEFEDPIITGQIDNLIYWAGRTAKTQDRLTDKSIKDIERELARQYKRAQTRVIRDFAETYLHVLARAEGGAVTPADLYKLDRYWQMQAQLTEELRRLGDKEAEILETHFIKQYGVIYDALAIPTEKAFSTISKDSALQVINSIWCADGKSWSARIWENTELLKQELNDKLIEVVTAGRKPAALKAELAERFNVRYYCSDRIVRTECAHISAQAAIQRYKDSGIKEMEVYARKDERRCEICGKLHKKRYPIDYISPLPAHPNCRCTLIPVIDRANVVQ